MSEWIEKTVAISQIEALLENGYEVEVDSPDGWVGVDQFVHKGFYEEYQLQLEDGTTVRCNNEHLFETATGWASAHQLLGLEEVNILTKNGFQKGIVRRMHDQLIPIVDITVNHANHRYYTEGVSSHNTGVGKSLAMCHFAATNLMHGKNVLYITLEMAEERIAERIDANLLDSSIDQIHEMPKDVFEKKINRLKTKTPGKLIVKEYPTASAGSAHFRHLLNELKLKKNFTPDIIYVDYLNICMSSRLKNGSNVNTYMYVKAIAEELRGLAVEFDVPLISATQTTRSGFASSDIDLTDTSESFGLPATADFMIALISTEELEGLGQIMIKQLKNRWGDPNMNKRFVVGIDRSRMRFYNTEQSAQDGIVDDTPVMSNSPFGQRWDEEEKDATLPKKFGKNMWKGFA